jgi:hypothetical protein
MVPPPTTKPFSSDDNLRESLLLVVDAPLGRNMWYSGSRVLVFGGCVYKGVPQ